MTPKHCWTALLLVVFFSLATACTDLKRMVDANPSGKEATLGKTSPTPEVSATPKPTPPVPAFKGDIAGKAGKQRLYEFFEGHQKKLVKLDLLLSDEELADLDTVDKGKRWYFDLSYQDEDGFNAGGELLIDISRGKAGLQLEGNHLQGLIQIIQWAGPHQGVMSINARPVSGEAVIQKPATPQKNPVGTPRARLAP